MEKQLHLKPNWVKNSRRSSVPRRPYIYHHSIGYIGVNRKLKL